MQEKFQYPCMTKKTEKEKETLQNETWMECFNTSRTLEYLQKKPKSIQNNSHY